jgi:NAD(P)-dependent dehydrogenase (short-subunit alcohol dehydrogenase family)
MATKKPARGAAAAAAPRPIDYKELFDLSGRVGIVTGGAGIIGKELVRGLLTHGAKVVIADIDARASEAFAATLRDDFGKRVIVVRTDVTDPKSVKAMVGRTVRQWGEVDFLLNNAALFGTNPKDYYAPFEEYSLEEWRRIMAVDLDGVFLVAREVGRQMVAQGTGGSIVQTSSIYGVMASDPRIYEGSTFKGYAINNPAVYSAAKAGVVGLTRWLATYWADQNIRVNAIAPGGTMAHENDVFMRKYSNRIPLGRMAYSSEMVGAVIYLVSDASSYVTGQCLMVDGGLSAW